MALPFKPNDVIESLWPVILRRMSERSVAAVELLDSVLQSQGPIRRRDHELRAGDRLLNEDQELLPPLARATSLGLSIYLGNRRIASSAVLDAGPVHEVGGYADAEVVETVLRKREMFRGTLIHAGRRQLVACKPLLPHRGAIEYGAIGMLEAYQDLDAFQALLDERARESIEGTPEGTIAEHADRMEDVMHFIDDVARRLQLLALNGNIIAAQAGDHGRAFRVVCRELSSLAEQSKQAVAQVRLLMDDLVPEDQDPLAGEGSGSR